MTDEEYLRNRLDRLNQNSYYGVMIDTEITDIVRRHIKRLEEKEMNATSVQTIENVKEMHFTIEKSCVDDITKVIVGASTNDDIFEFHFSGEGCVVFADQWFNMVSDKAYKADFESERNKRKIMETENSILRRNKKKYEEKIGELEKELGEWKKEAAEYLKDIDKVRREKNKEINELKQQLQQAENDKRRYEEKIKNLKHADMLDREAADSWSKEYYNLSKKFDELKEENEKLEAKSKDISDDDTLLLETNKELKKELALEKAANEAQHKFIREYAGKGTEVQFNYAIDDTKEVSYVIVDRKENAEVRSKILKYIEINNKLRDENEELKYQLGDIQATKEVVEEKLNTRNNVNHPSHYTGKYECIDVMQDVFGDEATDNFCLCNAFKYIWRARKKNGLEDVKKAVWYLNKYIEEAEKDGVPKGK